MTARDARQANDKLTIALLNAASRGDKIPCGEYSIAYLFLSESEQERKLAAVACHSCPVFNPCGEAADANQEVFGVRAGRDYTRRPGRKKVA
jgi:Transcription factor WhiB